MSRIYSAYAEKTDEPGVVVITNELQKKYVNDLQLLPDNNMIDIAKTALQRKVTDHVAVTEQ